MEKHRERKRRALLRFSWYFFFCSPQFSFPNFIFDSIVCVCLFFFSSSQVSIAPNATQKAAFFPKFVFRLCVWSPHREITLILNRIHYPYYADRLAGTEILLVCLHRVSGLYNIIDFVSYIQIYIFTVTLVAALHIRNEMKNEIPLKINGKEVFQFRSMTTRQRNEQKKNENFYRKLKSQTKNEQ